jgi:glycosyltransferase involved in cell wall biosynthesis
MVPSALTQTRPSVSVSCVLPNRNHARELRTSLAMIVGQTRPFDEIIVIDDASTDESVEVIEAFAAETPSLRLVKNPRQLGVAAAIRRGLEAAAGSHVVLASADERVGAELCAALTGALTRFPAAEIAVATSADWYPERGTVIAHGPDSDLGLWFLRDGAPEWVSPERFHQLLDEAPVSLSANAAILRRDLLMEVGVFDPALRWHGDWFALYALAFRYGFVAVPQSVAWFRHVATSYSARGMRDARLQDEVMRALLRKLREPGFADFRAALMRSPAAMSPLIRSMLRALARRPDDPRMLAAILRWWLREVLHLRRPGVLLRFRRGFARRTGIVRRTAPAESRK